jgi:hypothetical protein
METLEDVFRVLKKEATGTKAYFPDKTHRAFPVSREFFKPIPFVRSEASLFFIDGGQAELFSSPDFCIALMRVACSAFQQNKRVKLLKEDFTVSIRAEFIEDKLSYVVTTYPAGFFSAPIVFEAFDRNLSEGAHRAKLSKILEEVRKCAEIVFANRIVQENVVAGDIIILDGDLEATNYYAKQYYEQLYPAAASKDVLITALAKTSTLLTDTGGSFTALLEGMSSAGIWYYTPVAEINSPKHLAEIFFVKLSEFSKHIFKFEIYNRHPPLDLEKIFSLLAQNSRDLTFPGYPYGMILADKLARVSEQEKSEAKLRMSVKFSKEVKEISSSISATNAHEILDKIAYKKYK